MCNLFWTSSRNIDFMPSWRNVHFIKPKWTIPLLLTSKPNYKIEIKFKVFQVIMISSSVETVCYIMIDFCMY